MVTCLKLLAVPQVVNSWIKLGPVPMSAAGERIVITHGDFHTKNILWTPGGEIVVIDVESACVASAVQDMAIAFRQSLHGDYNMGDMCRHKTHSDSLSRFVGAYLEASSLPFAAEDVGNVIHDVERCALLFGNLAFCELRATAKDPSYVFGILRSCCLAAQCAQA